MRSSVMREQVRLRKWSVVSLIGVICPIVVSAAVALSALSVSQGRARAAAVEPTPAPRRPTLPDAGSPPPGLDAGRLEPLEYEPALQPPR